MTNDRQIEQFSMWAKQRVDEIEATLKAVDARMATLQADAKAQAEKTAAEMREERDAFQRVIGEKQQEGAAAWEKVRGDLQHKWAAFETTVQTYMTQAKLTAEQQQALFQARAEAQRKAWQDSIESFMQQASGYAAAKKPDLDAAIAHAKSEAETAKSKLDAGAKAGAQSWDAFKAALEESRMAFEKAGQKARDAFDRAN